MLSNSINMVEIIIADGIALLVLFICAFSNMVRMKIKKRRWTIFINLNYCPFPMLYI